ncbi:uncharacterized protein LOC125026001 [Penaeus chinensis]|uniref:uncharacterized protein LOC125026001 n=1 Tax=Penaeus chinensis TaxID=139456 RepID=UPI001FB59E07|nr:uncharacterized protein LOC125026001 [Penaeus chinensis]
MTSEEDLQNCIETTDLKAQGPGVHSHTSRPYAGQPGDLISHEDGLHGDLITHSQVLTSGLHSVTPRNNLKEPETSVVETYLPSSSSLGLSKYSLLLKLLKTRGQRRIGGTKSAQTVNDGSHSNKQKETKRCEIFKLRHERFNGTGTNYTPDCTISQQSNITEVEKNMLSSGLEDDWSSDEEMQYFGSYSQAQREFHNKINLNEGGESDSNCKNSSDLTCVKPCRTIRQSDPFGRILDKFDIFICRIKVSLYAKTISGDLEDASESLSDLGNCLLDIKSSFSYSEVIEKLSSFTKCIENNSGLASVFLLHFTQYISSELALENNLREISGFVECMSPCIEAAIKGYISQDVISDIKNQNLIQNLLLSVAALFKEETKYKESSIRTIMEYGKGANPAKAQIIRMSTEDSKTIFQETFADVGPHMDLYTIYFWYIINVCKLEVKDGKQSSMISMTKALEASGKFINTLPTSELKSRKSELLSINEKQNVHQPGEFKVIQANDTSAFAAPSSSSSTCSPITASSPVTASSPPSTPTPASELRYQWVDFRLGQLYENGVAFLVNMENWQEKLLEISRLVQNLEVKKHVRFSPSLGATFALFLREGLRTLTGKASVAYIRVRVVRVVGPVVCVYGIDTGTTHTCHSVDLILLPSTVLSQLPAGRLAFLPVAPTPEVSSLTHTLALLLALIQHSDLSLDLQGVDIRPVAKWLHCDDLVPLTVQLLQAVVDVTQNADRLCNICSLLTDYLERTVYRKSSLEFPIDESLPKMLISVMQKSPKARFTAAKNGAFMPLCEIGMQTGSKSAWEALKTLLGGKESLGRWSQLSQKVSKLHAFSNPDSLKAASIADKEQHDQSDPSMRVMRVADLASDRTWDLEIRSSIKSRQLVAYNELKEGWHWVGQEVLTADVGELCSGHILNVTNDETHHIILDKSVPNIRMNTVLQIILGMLNTGLGGKIYIGLSSKGIVCGAKMTRVQRDCFMLGFSKLVTSEIFPMLLPCNSLIQFIPVVRPGSTLNVLPSLSSSLHTTLPSDASVIIMTVKPQPNTIYRCRDDPEALLLREGGVNTFVRGQKTAQMINASAMWTKELQEEVEKEKQLLLNTISSEDT